MLANVPMVRAGDVLIVCFEKRLAETDTQRFVDMARDVLPGVRVAFLEGVSGLAVFRPDAATSEAESE